MRDFEHKVNGRVLCKRHDLLRCSECAYIDELEKENERYRKTLELIKTKALDIEGGRDASPFEIYSLACDALEGEE